MDELGIMDQGNPQNIDHDDPERLEPVQPEAYKIDEEKLASLDGCLSEPSVGFPTVTLQPSQIPQPHPPQRPASQLSHTSPTQSSPATQTTPTLPSSQKMTTSLPSPATQPDSRPPLPHSSCYYPSPGSSARCQCARHMVVGYPPSGRILELAK